MARTIKKGLDYFPFDVDLFQDIRIRKLIKYQGGKAVTVYTLLLCTIYRNGYYAMWDKELPFILSEISGYTEAYILEVIECCMNIGLFSKELFESAKVLSSRGIQERYRKICSASRRNAPINEHSLLDKDENADTANQSKPQRAYAPPQKEKPQQPQPIPQEPVTAIYNKTIEQEVTDMKSDNAWMKSICNRRSISPEQLMAYIDDFSLQCSKSHTSFRDAKSHFHRWLVKQNRETTATTITTAPSQSPDYTYDGGFGGQDI